MAFEREAIQSTPTPATGQIEMREPREVNPYASRSFKQPVAPSESVETKTTSAETVTLSPAAAAIARREQKFRQQQQEFKSKESSLEAERAEIAELKALKAKLAAKDYSGIDGLVDYNEYTNYLIDKSVATSPEQAELKKLAMELEGVKKAQQDDVSKRFEAAVNDRRKAVKELVASNEDFSSIKELKLEEHVVQHILDTWEHDQIDLTPEQAAKEVEDLVLERAAKWTSLPKIKGKGDSAEKKQELPPMKPGMKTLTNNMIATGEIKRPQKSFQGMTDSERYAEARRRAEEKLKQGIK